MRWFIMAMVMLFTMVSAGYTLYSIQAWLNLPEWLSGLIVLAGTVWLAQWLSKEIDDRFFK